MDFEWGSDAAALGRQPDMIIGADVIYEEHCFEALLASIEALSAAHTISFVAYRTRGAKLMQYEHADMSLVALPDHQLSQMEGLSRLLVRGLAHRSEGSVLICRARREDL